jgi:hypothetical protein
LVLDFRTNQMPVEGPEHREVGLAVRLEIRRLGDVTRCPNPIMEIATS